MNSKVITVVIALGIVIYLVVQGMSYSGESFYQRSVREAKEERERQSNLETREGEGEDMVRVVGRVYFKPDCDVSLSDCYAEPVETTVWISGASGLDFHKVIETSRTGRFQTSLSRGTYNITPSPQKDMGSPRCENQTIIVDPLIENDLEFYCDPPPLDLR